MDKRPKGRLDEAAPRNVDYATSDVDASRIARPRDRARWELRDDRKLSSTAKLVWLMLDTRGADPRPSKATLAADCGLDKRTVDRAIGKLVSAGWLRVHDRRTECGDADTNIYELTCPGGGGTDTPGGYTSATTHIPRVGTNRIPTVGTPVPPEDKREARTKHYSRAASSRSKSGQGSAANSPKPRVHDGPKNDGTQAQQNRGQVPHGDQPGTSVGARGDTAGHGEKRDDDEEQNTVMTMRGPDGGDDGIKLATVTDINDGQKSATVTAINTHRIPPGVFEFGAGFDSAASPWAGITMAAAEESTGVVGMAVSA